MKIDRASLLVELDGAATLGASEDALRAAGLTLGVEPLEASLTVATWIARGTPGARDSWEDPADHVLAGLDATFTNGRRISVRPSPRRAVGPDLVALVHGMAERFARVDRAWVRVHPLDATRSRTHPLTFDRDPPIEPAEAALFDAVGRALES